MIYPEYLPAGYQRPNAPYRLEQLVDYLRKNSRVNLISLYIPLTVGKETEAVVVEIDAENEKVKLSLKHLEKNPYSKYYAGQVVEGTVKRVSDFGAFVELEPGIEALLRHSEISTTKVDNPMQLVKVGQKIEAKVIKSDLRERKIDISVKKLDFERERELLRKYTNNKSDRPTLGQLLEEDNAE